MQMELSEDSVTLILTQGHKLFGQKRATKKLFENVLAILTAVKYQRFKHIRIHRYENIIDNYLHEDFQNHFRMSRSSMGLLIKLCEASRTPKLTIGRPQVPVKLQCLICVWVLANQESYRSIGDRFDVTKRTVFVCLMRVCKLINARHNIFITWPQGIDARSVIESFRRKKSFPGVLGAIDGCHIAICPPKTNAFAYINRKNRASMVLQAVCDSNAIFTDIFVGFPGSVHDARIFHCSKVSRMCNEDNYFPEDSHLLGDSAYPLCNRLLTPFRDDGHLSRKQVHYNVSHASTRSAIERAFGILKARWRRLNYLELHIITNYPIVISAACMLHNFCQRQGEAISLYEREDEFINEANELNGVRNTEAVTKRNNIMNALQEIN